MDEYGPTPKVKRISLTPRVRREKPGQRTSSLERIENAIMGKLIYVAGNIAGKQAAMIAYNYGLRDKEKLRYVQNFAQDEARSDTLRLMDELRASGKPFPNVTINAEWPRKRRDESVYNMGLKQLMEDNI